MSFLKKVFKPWVIVILVIAITGVGYYFYYKSHKGNNSTTYKTASVTKGTITATVSGSGNLYVEKSENVTSEVSGDVKNLSVKVGDTVTKGQTLFKVTNDDLDVSVSKAYASLLQAQQTVSDSEYDLTQSQKNQTETNDNANSSDDQKTEAAQKVAKANVALEVAKVNLTSAQSSYNTAKKTATKRTVTASIGGTVTEVNIADGDTIGSGSSSSASSSSSGSSSSTSTATSAGTSSSSAAIVITDLSSLKASISLNEVDAASVAVGQSVTMTFDAIDDLSLTGKIESIGLEGTESSGVVTYPAVVVFDSLDSRLKSQMSVTAIITTEVKQNILYVPNSAVKSNDTLNYVLLMKDGAPVQQTVEIGIANDSYTEITSGLSENDSVVTQTITSSSAESSSSTSKTSSKSSSLQGLTSGGGTPPSGMGGPGM